MIGWMSAAWFGFAESVLLDPKHGVAYVAAPGGGIDAVRIADGQRWWHSASADLPLDVAADRLIAWSAEASTVRIVSLDVTQQGRVSSSCEDISAPQGFSIGIDHTLGASSSVVARVRGDRIEAYWSAERHYVGGQEPPPHILEAANRSWSGSGECGPDGRWTMGEGSAPDRGIAVPDVLRSKVAGGRPVGDQWLYADPDPQSKTLRLGRWDLATGELRSSARLAPYDPQRPSGGYFSVDGLQIAVIDWVPSGTPTRSVVFDTANGQMRATLPGVALIDWALIDGVYVATTNDTLSGYGADGEKRWSVPVRVRAYEGPIPP